MTDSQPGRPGEVLRVEGVSVSLAGRPVLGDVSFTVGAGQFTGLIGPNGAGKTTLLRVILGLQRPSAGQVTLPRQAGRAARLGYVPQKVLLDPDMPLRARDLVGLGLDGHRLGIPLRSRQRREAVSEMLHAVGADHYADAKVGSLSGGEQQRVLIAHALISRPPLLLLDEPLANLDLHSGQEIIALLDRIATEHQVAILLSAHEMNALLPVTDRIVYLAGGRAVSGTTAEVVRPDVLSRLYGHHVDVLHVHGRILVVAGAADEPGAAGHEAEVLTGTDDQAHVAAAPVAGAGAALPAGAPGRKG
ncbi:MAG TPA: metal ABC transporter ATP-binding protein [Streptosporangiaceae bacterium]